MQPWGLYSGTQHPVCRRFRYDTQSTPDTGVTVANTLGRVEFAGTDDCGSQGNGQWNQITREWFSYSVRGELTDFYELTPNSGGFYHTTAGYAPNGAVTSLGLPAAAGSWTFTLDGEGRPFSASNGSTVNVASVTYNAASQPLVISYSALNKDNDTYTYYDTTGRMHTYAFTIGSTPKTILGTYTWNQNGSLQNLAITDPFYAVDQQTCNYLYDDLARLSSADCGATVWQQNFTYDAYGNLTKAVPTGGTGITWNPGYNPANNHYTLGGTTYDNDGNLTYDTFNNYTWDAYGQMATVNTQAITYDALGREVEKSNPTREILYSPVGKVAIMNGVTTVSASFVPMPGGSSINAISGSTFIRHMNLLGTASVFSSLLNRQIYEDKAFAPFGEVYNVGLAGGGETDFAELSQDTLTGLNDSATRKQSPGQGRWFSPDSVGPAAVDPSNPQTWNRYAYVNNNPVINIDPLGLMCLVGHCGYGDGGDGGGLDGGSAGCDFFGVFCAGPAQGPMGPPNGPPKKPPNGPPKKPQPPEPPPVLKRGQPQCFAQVKTRGVQVPYAQLVSATHSFWYVQDTLGNQATVSGGPSGPTNGFLDVWTNYNTNSGVDNASAGTSWNSGLSSDNCNGADEVLTAAGTWPQDTVPYAPLGPNSNTVANYLGGAGGFSPPVPSGAWGWNTQLPTVVQPLPPVP